MKPGFLQVCVLNRVPVCIPKGMMKGIYYYPLVCKGALVGTNLELPSLPNCLCSQNLQEHNYHSDLVSIKLG